MLPASTVPKDRPIRIKTGLTISTARILPKIVRCYKCHMLKHNQWILTVTEMNVEGYLLTTRQEVRYLGVQLNCRKRFEAHLEKVRGKADALMRAFGSLLPNINGPTGSVRRLYYGVWESVVLYAALVWAKVLEIKKNRKILNNILSVLTRISTTYRSVPCSAVRAYGHYAHLFHSGASGRKISYKKEESIGAVQRTFKSWGRLCLLRGDYGTGRAYHGEMEVRFYREDNWTKRLVADAYLFRRYRRNIDHFTIQILTGHGIFNVYRKMINKEDHSTCWNCNAEGDDAEHALFHCPR